MNDPMSVIFQQVAGMAGGEIRRIFLEGHVVECNIGIHDFERTAPQKIRIDVDLYVKPPQGGRTGSVKDVVDYDFLREGIRKIVGGEHIDLQEQLVERIVELSFSNDDVLAVRASSRKLDVYPDCQSVGVEICRVRKI